MSTLFHGKPIKVTVGGVSISYGCSPAQDALEDIMYAALVLGPSPGPLWMSHECAKALAPKRPVPTLVIAQQGLPHVDIITCDSDEEARALVALCCAETVGGRQ